MKSLGSCYSEGATKVFDPCCSGSSIRDPRPPNSVISIYKANLSSNKRLLITLSWCKNRTSERPIICISDNFSCPSESNDVSCTLRDKKGMKKLPHANSSIEVSWDISKARYAAGPEAVKNYYIAVLCDSELCLFLGDMHGDSNVKRLEAEFPSAKFSLVSRNEYFSGDFVYSSKAQFSDTGSMHDILIKCFSSEEGGPMRPVLTVEIDKRVVVQEKRLRWNFRGNQSLYVDGLLVDMMWDVHDWFFKPESGCALFLFRRRSEFQTRLWLEENNVEHKIHDSDEFSLLVSASKDSD